MNNVLILSPLRQRSTILAIEHHFCSPSSQKLFRIMAAGIVEITINIHIVERTAIGGKVTTDL